MAPARWLFAAALALGCGAAANPATLYQRGVDEFDGGRMGPAAEALEGFVAKACGAQGSNPRCREAYVKLGHARERLGQPGGAWAAYDAALGFGPHTRDEAVKADLDRTQTELVEKNGREPTRSPVIVRYRDEVSETYSARSVVISLDFDPVLTKDKDAGELHAPDYRKVYGGSVPAGEHVLVVEAVHDCRPGGGAPCARSKVRKAWPFRNAAHTPTTIEIRAYDDQGWGDAPARPALELIAR
jgi:hypothetical protein